MAEKKKMTKSAFVAAVADKTGMTKRDAAAAIEAVNAVAMKELKKTGEVTIPGLLKLIVAKKPAVKAGERKNPFTGEMKFYPAKPARKIVKARPVKALKDAV